MIGREQPPPRCSLCRKLSRDAGTHGVLVEELHVLLVEKTRLGTCMMSVFTQNATHRPVTDFAVAAYHATCSVLYAKGQVGESTEEGLQARMRTLPLLQCTRTGCFVLSIKMLKARPIEHRGMLSKVSLLGGMGMRR